MNLITVKKDWKRNKTIYIMVLPVIAFYIIFHYAPMAGVIMAFENYSIKGGLFGSQWVGLKNFIDFFQKLLFFQTAQKHFSFKLLRPALRISRADYFRTYDERADKQKVQKKHSNHKLYALLHFDGGHSRYNNRLFLFQGHDNHYSVAAGRAHGKPAGNARAFQDNIRREQTSGSFWDSTA